MSVQIVRMSRQARYDQVWSEAVTKVASLYNLTDNGLRKICLKHDVPLPPRGYWRQIQTGRKVTPKALPTLEVEWDIVFQMTLKTDDSVEGAASSQPAIEAERARDQAKRIDPLRPTPPSISDTPDEDLNPPTS